jgi:hypothetical protein
MQRGRSEFWLGNIPTKRTAKVPLMMRTGVVSLLG